MNIVLTEADDDDDVAYVPLAVVDNSKRGNEIQRLTADNAKLRRRVQELTAELHRVRLSTNWSVLPSAT